MRSNGCVLLGMHTQLLEPTTEDIINNENNRVIAVGFRTNSYTQKDSLHIRKKIFICVKFSCYN